MSLYNRAMVSQSKTVILVVGMHRSGTSALTGLLHRFGVAVPLAPGTRIGADNPRGHWEHTQVNRINDDILRASGQTWSSWKALDPDAVPAAQRDRLRAFLATGIDAADSAVVAFKDPRMCLLLTTWKSVIRDLGHDLRVVFCFRHPMAVARSISRRNDLCPERGLLLWLHYNLEALAALDDVPYLSLMFPAWMAALQSLHRDVALLTGAELPTGWRQCCEDAEAFIDGDLVHQVQDEGDAGFLGSHCLGLYDRLIEGGSHPGPELRQFARELGRELAPWMQVSATVVQDERRIWRNRINDVHALINRNL